MKRDFWTLQKITTVPAAKALHPSRYRPRISASSAPQTCSNNVHLHLQPFQASSHFKPDNFPSQGSQGMRAAQLEWRASPAPATSHCDAQIWLQLSRLSRARQSQHRVCGTACCLLQEAKTWIASIDSSQREQLQHSNEALRSEGNTCSDTLFKRERE